MIMRLFVGSAYFHYSFLFHLIAAFQIMLCYLVTPLKKGAAANTRLVGHAQNSSFPLTPDMNLCRKLKSFWKFLECQNCILNFLGS